MKKLTLYLTLLFLVGFLSNPIYAQQDSTVKKEKIFKNTIRYCITNPLLFGGNSMIFGYERTLGNHQSISLNVGQISIPKLLPGDISISDSITLNNTSTQKGYNVAVDYRFYLSKENKYNAPRGVYLAPYFAYNHFERANSWALNTTNFQGNVSTNFQLTFETFGGELGYQFVLWKRLAIDLILIGPGIAHYEIKTKLDTELSVGDQEELFQKINDFLSSKIPGYSLVIDDQEYKKSGTNNTTSIGYRYMVHLGFRF